MLPAIALLLAVVRAQTPTVRCPTLSCTHCCIPDPDRPGANRCADTVSACPVAATTDYDMLLAVTLLLLGVFALPLACSLLFRICCGSADNQFNLVRKCLGCCSTHGAARPRRDFNLAQDQLLGSRKQTPEERECELGFQPTLDIKSSERLG